MTWKQFWKYSHTHDSHSVSQKFVEHVGAGVCYTQREESVKKKHTKKKTNQIHESRNIGGGRNVRCSFDDDWPTTVIKNPPRKKGLESVENATLPRIHLDFSAIIYPFTVFSLWNINWKKKIKIKINVRTCVQRKINKKFKFLFFKMDDIVVTNSLWQLERIWPKRVVFQSKVQLVSWKIKCWTFHCLFWHVWLSLSSPFAAIVHTCWRFPLFTWNVFIIIWKMYHKRVLLLLGNCTPHRIEKESSENGSLSAQQLQQCKYLSFAARLKPPCCCCCWYIHNFRWNSLQVDTVVCRCVEPGRNRDHLMMMMTTTTTKNITLAV